MSTPQRTGPTGQRPYARESAEDATLTRNLRFELAGEEGRALIGSYAISFALAAAFLLFVYLYPEIPPPIPERISVLDLPPPEEVQLPPPPEPTQTQEAEAAPQRQTQTQTPRPSPATQRTTTTSGGDVGDAFRGTPATGGVAGSVAGQLRGVDVSGGGNAPGGGGTGTKAVIRGGSGSGTAATPGRGGVPGDAGTAGNIGGVSGSGGVGIARIGVSTPQVITAPDVGRGGRDMGALGSFVRSHQRELQFCYQEHGLKVNPSLAGTIHVAIGIAGSGQVSSASVNRRSWSGAGVSAVESCVLSRIRAWRFPASDAGPGTYSFPFNFTRGG